jgi:hypothetical protein
MAVSARLSMMQQERHRRVSREHQLPAHPLSITPLI